MAKSLKRSIDHVESPRLQHPDEYEPTNAAADPSDCDDSYRLELYTSLGPWIFSRRQRSVSLDDSLMSATNDGFDTVEWHAGNVLLPLSPIIRAQDSGEPDDLALERDLANRDVCYGMLRNARLKTLEVQSVSRESLGPITPDIGFRHVNLVFEDQCFYIKSESSELVAVLNEATSKILQDILAMKNCYFKAYIAEDDWDDFGDSESKTEKNTYLSVDIVLYGPQEMRNTVGKLLSKARTYLQHPCHQESNTLYDNPHVLKLVDSLPQFQSTQPSTPPFTMVQSNYDTTEIAETQIEEGSPQSQILRKVATVFESLTRSKNLSRLEADVRIKTPLLPHQEEALDFMSQREFGPIPQEYSLWSHECCNGRNYYEHKISGCKTSRLPAETGGGILADDMGLGKTLTVISTIIRTANEAKVFAEKERGQENGSADLCKRIPSKSTLVVCPSPLLLQGWIQEIKNHCNGSVSIITYHGQGRESDPLALANTDLVLSTYHTIAAEALDSSSPLYKIEWFRIVLDEAHIIRRMSTKLCRAVSKISANFRWCLTGTPVQNSLEDLASLVAFIRVSQLDNLLDFRKYVIAPLLKNTGSGADALRCLLDSICLRRTKKLLHLPEDRYECRNVDFSATERVLYSTTQREMVKAVKEQDNQPKNAKRYFSIFQLWLKLRRLCNHGTFQKPFSLAPGETIQFDPEEALALLRQREDAKCRYCSVEVAGLHGIDEGGNGHFTVCGYLVCSECVPRYKKALRKNEAGTGFQCSLCLQNVSRSCLLTGKMVTKNSTNRTVSGEDYFEADGICSKVSALVADIEQNSTETKGIVFSCWTRSLDLVGRFLDAQKIRFARIDGSLSLSERQKMLADFESEPSISVLIMTTGTGATGLNLTVASIVYILEPQWNPMVEDQAIGRVLRLGQKKEVKVIRYIIKDSVEEVMLTQQTRKLEFAKVGWREDES